jgi:hypothetical protein
VFFPAPHCHFILCWGTPSRDLEVAGFFSSGGKVSNLSGSPAVDTGYDSACYSAAGTPYYGAVAIDQRDVARPVGAHCDIGAFEGIQYQVVLLLVNK